MLTVGGRTGVITEWRLTVLEETDFICDSIVPGV